LEESPKKKNEAKRSLQWGKGGKEDEKKAGGLGKRNSTEGRKNESRWKKKGVSYRGGGGEKKAMEKELIFLIKKVGGTSRVRKASRRDGQNLGGSGDQKGFYFEEGRRGTLGGRQTTEKKKNLELHH